uniref:Soluble epoxide hydrolase n=1 Tax=Rhipicephalus appendiculatus TaxID=34631 RepID=A0A131Z0C6_RHIAP
MALPPAVAKLMILAIGTSMWIWMEAYVKVQVALHGQAILEPHRRSEPPEFSDVKLGRHAFANVNGIKMHYVHKGCQQHANGPILLLLHGFLDFWYIWNRQLPTLAEYFCVVAPDLRGYGLTTKPEDSADYLMVTLVKDVTELIRKINPQNKRRLVLVGHDWGAMIGFCLATLHENLISRMVIINGMHPKAFYKQLLLSPRQMRMSWYMIPFRHPRIPEQYLIMRDLAFFDKVHTAFTVREEYAHKYMFSQPGALTGALNYYRAFNHDKEQLDKLNYRRLSVPALILWGQKDEFLTTRVARFNTDWLTAPTVLFYRNAGHWLLRECSGSVNRYIVAFAKSGQISVNALHANTSNNRPNEDACRHFTTAHATQIHSTFALVPPETGIPGFSEE